MYSMDVRVRYSELGKGGSITLHKFLNYFQDIATFHSEDLGYGLEKNLEDHHGWFLIAYDIQVKRYPRMGEHLCIQTDPYKFRTFYGYRKFYVYDEAGQEIANADSLWIFMDLEKMLPVKASEEMCQAYMPVPSQEKVRVKRKLSDKGEWEYQESIEISPLYLDSNEHVNNGYYCLWAEKHLKSREKVSEVKIDYRKSAFNHDTLRLYTFHDDHVLHVKYMNQEDELVAVIEMIDKETI